MFHSDPIHHRPTPSPEPDPKKVKPNGKSDKERITLNGVNKPKHWLKEWPKKWRKGDLILIKIWKKTKVHFRTGFLPQFKEIYPKKLKKYKDNSETFF